MVGSPSSICAFPPFIWVLDIYFRPHNHHLLLLLLLLLVFYFVRVALRNFSGQCCSKGAPRVTCGGKESELGNPFATLILVQTLCRNTDVHTPPCFLSSIQGLCVEERRPESMRRRRSILLCVVGWLVCE